MTFIATESEEVTLAELHDLNPDDYTGIAVEVRRRYEPGANQFGGVQFLSSAEKVAQFETVEEALSFIDDLHAGGIPAAVRGQLGDNIDDAAVLDALQFTPENTNPSVYLERAGVTDPFNLQIIPKKQYMQEVEIEDPTTADVESKADTDTSLQV